MKDLNLYEIDILSHIALWLIQWKKIVLAAIASAVLLLAWSAVKFEPPSTGTKENRQIETALAYREIVEQRIHMARKDMEENLFYSMDPAKLMTKQLTISVALQEPERITEQVDPTDLVLYTYHNTASTQLRGEVLVPGILTKLQQEQLLALDYNSETNTMQVSVTSDNEPLMDAVLETAAQWYRDHQDSATALTEEHTLTFFPVSVHRYDRSTAESMVSNLDAESKIWELEGKILSYNTILDENFNKTSGWAASRSTQELHSAYQQKLHRESRFPWKSLLMKGGILGALVTMFACSAWSLGKGYLLGADGIFHAAGWPRIGRLNAVSRSRDLLVSYGRRLLYPDLNSNAPEREVAEMTAMLLKDRGVTEPYTIGLVGTVSPSAMEKVRKCLESDQYALETAQLLQDRIGVNRLCRQADAVIFVGAADRTTLQEVSAMHGLLQALGKTPLGYVLV